MQISEGILVLRSLDAHIRPFIFSQASTCTIKTVLICRHPKFLTLNFPYPVIIVVDIPTHQRFDIVLQPSDVSKFADGYLNLQISWLRYTTVGAGDGCRTIRPVKSAVDPTGSQLIETSNVDGQIGAVSCDLTVSIFLEIRTAEGLLQVHR